VGPLEGPRRPDDVRLDEVIEFWRGDPAAITAGRAVIIGFPQDEGVRRSGGRPGAARAPQAIRRWLYRLTPYDSQAGVGVALHPPLDLGNVRLGGSLEDTQTALGDVVAEILSRGAIPVVLGGGHETAYGHYLGYVGAKRQTAIINLDAHLDVRPVSEVGGHSGSPFRQALEHSAQPLPGDHYVCLGAEPHATSRSHWRYASERGCVVRWRDELQPSAAHHFERELARLEALGCAVYVSIDADVVRMADVPGVSAPNPLGLSADEVIACARLAGRTGMVSSFELVEVNPIYDRDEQSARWGALVVWSFLLGVASRPSSQKC
jgi:formiminoglutamase